MAVQDWATAPASNTSISGININEGCGPSGINNAIRQVMADVRVMYDNLPSTANLMPKAAGVFSGTQPTYTGRGCYLHHNSSAMSSGRIFLQAAGGATPSGMISGDILLEY